MGSDVDCSTRRTSVCVVPLTSLLTMFGGGFVGVSPVGGGFVGVSPVQTSWWVHVHVKRTYEMICKAAHAFNLALVVHAFLPSPTC